MKHPRPLRFLLGISIAALLLIGCGAGVGSHGWTAPVQTTNFLLVSPSKGKLDALNNQTNDKTWRFPNDWSISTKSARSLKGIYGQPVLSSDGHVVFVGDYNGYLYAFRPSQAAQSGGSEPQAAALKLNGPIIGGITLDSSSNTLYVTSGNDIYKVSAADMTRKIDENDNQKVDVEHSRLISTGGETWGRPVLSGGKLFVSSLSGKLYALNPANGAELWHFTASAGIATTPVISGNTVLVGGFDSKLHAIDSQTGKELWSFKTKNWVWTEPVLDGSKVYVGDFDGNVFALNLSDGSELWRVKVADSPIVGAPVLSGGTLVVGVQNGKVFAVETSSQTSRLLADVRTTLRADLTVQNNRVLLAPSGCVTPEGQENKVYYLGVDTTSGELRSTGSVC